MELVLLRVIVDDQLINIRLHLPNPVEGQEQAIRGHEDKAFRKLFSGIPVLLHDAGIQKRLIVAVQQ